MQLIQVFPRFTSFHNDDSVTNTAVELKAEGAVLVGGNVYNPDTADVAYLVFFDLAADDVDLGTTEPVFSLAVPAGESLTFECPRPIHVATALSCAATSTRLGSGAPSSALTLWVAFR